MDTVRPANLGLTLLGKTRGAVLSLLLGAPDEEFHVRQIARLSGATLGPAQRELKLLVQLGLLQSRRSGHQLLYRADASSPIHAELQSIVVKTVGLADALKAALRPIASQVKVAFLFGSFARGTHRSASDVDLMLIGRPSIAAVVKLLGEPQRRLGREINPTIYQPAEFASKLRSGHHFLNSVMDGPRIFIIGDEDELRGVAEERLAASPQKQPPRSRGAARRH